MEIKNQTKNISFKLEILGYQFPNSNDIYDSNWLIISLCICSNGTTWKLKDPMLQTFEIEKLSKWFISNKETLYFLEPNISFIKKHVSKDTISLKIFFSKELNIPNHFINSIHNKIFFEFEIPIICLEQYSNELQSMLGNYPIRGRC